MKNILKSIYFLTLLPLMLSAQGMDLIKLDYGFFPAVKLNEPFIKTLEEAEVEIKELKLQINYPIVLSEKKSFLINSFSYDMLDFTFNNLPSKFTYLGPEKLYSISYGLTLVHKFDNKWTLNALIKPTLASDLENVDSDHYKILAAGTLNYKFSENTEAGFGAAYNTDFGEPMLIPVIRFKHDINNKLFIDFVLPKKASIVYILNSKIDFGLEGKINGNHFRISKEDSPAKDNSLKYSVISFGPTVKIKMTNKFNLCFNTGVLINRVYESYDSSRNQLREADLTESIFVIAGVSYGL